MRTVLCRAPVPETIERLVFGRRHPFASSVIRATLALPLSGGAVMLALMTEFPFSSVATPKMRVYLAPGVRRSATLSPLGSFVKGEASVRLGKIIDERILQSPKQQDQYHR